MKIGCQMNDIESVLRQGFSPRREQLDLAEFISGSSLPALAVQADTGTGKSAVILAAAIDAARKGYRVIISTHTIQLLRQIESEAAKFKADDINIGVRLGIQNYISAARVNHAWARLIIDDENTDDIDVVMTQLLTFATEGSGLIEDYIAEFGELPVNLVPSDICLLPTAKAADKRLWAAARQEAQEFNVTIQTHAMTLAQARYGVLPELIIFDEADALSDVAEGSDDKILSLATLREAMKQARLETDLLEKLVADPQNNRLRETLAETLDASRADEAVRHFFNQARWILKAHRMNGLRRGTEVRRAHQDIVIRSLWADRTRWIWSNLTDAGARRVIFMSATLAVGSPIEYSLRRFGVPLDSSDSFEISPAHFGNVSFNLISEATPQPIKSGEIDPEWRAAAVEWLQTSEIMADRSRPFILSKSYDDAAFFADELGLTAHEKGKPLSHYAKQFRQGDIRGLVTPAGWAGVDLPGIISDLVILRLPYASVDNLKNQIMGKGNFHAVKSDMQRRLRQGLGRGIRRENDEVRIWICDPRIYDPSTGVAAAIPDRFRDQFLVALGQLQMKSTALRPDQSAFRDLLLKHYGRCAISGVTTAGALQAAHLPGREWKLGHNKLRDGILLRSDLHSLYDRGDITIVDGVVHVDPSIADDYGQYDGVRIQLSS